MRRIDLRENGIRLSDVVSGSGGGPVDPGYTDYELETQSLFLKVNTTTVTLKDGKTAAVASNDHIKIVDEDMKHYTLKEWNDRSVANGFDNSMVAKPIGFSLECNGVRTIVRWQWTGKYYSPTGAGTAATDVMQHSIYDYNQITAAAMGKDATITGELDMGTGKAGTHFSDDWEVRDNGDTLTLYSGNTKHSWEMAKDCGNINSMTAINFKERTDAMWAQNEWMRHRFAISSGIATDQPDGTMKEVQILNVTGTQPQVGEDMYFYIDGTNTNLLAKYNLNNKHNGPADYLATAIVDYIYEQQKATFDADENAFEAAMLSGEIVVHRPVALKLIQKAEFLFDSGASALIRQTAAVCCSSIPFRRRSGYRICPCWPRGSQPENRRRPG